MFESIREQLATGAKANELTTEKRTIGPFDRILLKDYGDLVISQGQAPGITITAHKAILARIEVRVSDGRLTLGYRNWRDRLGEALTTSPVRKPIRYQLTVTDLAAIECQGVGRVTGQDLQCDDLAVRVRGVASVELKNLKASSLAVNMAAAGRIVLSGNVSEQDVVVQGPGYYIAGELQSDRAKVNVQGPGTVTVRVENELETTIFGPGQVAYYGAPRLTKRLIGPAVVRKVADRWEVTA